MQKVIELRELNVKMVNLESSYAQQVEELYRKISQQEAKYKEKVDEISSLKQ